ncbi:unnamed protein product [marine sediment metagenome]|uniref:Transposase zinc-ribbon domain-containing protein n=1 Tax=marine sediment metagenome TaxID=412755 RepID=X0U6X0_9ZZZZ
MVKMKILKSVPTCCGRAIDLVTVQNKKLFFQCKVCGKVVISSTLGEAFE